MFIETFFFTNVQDLQSWAAQWAKTLTPGVSILLEGELGSGKTSFVQGLAQGLGITDCVTSPTFALMQVYTQGRISLVHCDLYRLAPAEVWSLGLHEEWPDALIAVEWAQRLPFVPQAQVKVQFDILESGRHVTVEGRLVATKPPLLLPSKQT